VHYLCLMITKIPRELGPFSCRGVGVRPLNVTVQTKTIQL